ncbi:uncharacterized protein LOC121774763 isoform X1 [Salvia splendens]|uniref:uncharacterized protein LOC121774763 isoform X1 n=1 Tax=Salvia splendens TaxID=180675 RepID=UPI001C27E931|nr:uncharacterized protein LOC121774763 isoform X1 [Salvia splendens]
MTAHRYCRRSIAAGTDSPLRIHSLDSLADSGLRSSCTLLGLESLTSRTPAAASQGCHAISPSVGYQVPPSGERHSRIHRAVAAVGVSLRLVSFSNHIGCTVNFVGLPWTSRLRLTWKNLQGIFLFTLSQRLWFGKGKNPRSSICYVEFFSCIPCVILPPGCPKLNRLSEVILSYLSSYQVDGIALFFLLIFKSPILHL